jgi:hypothetical protein
VKRILIVLIVLLVAVVAAVAFAIDRILSEGIERGGSYALGVPTRVGFVRLALLDGSFRLRGLRVANPPGFDEPHFLRLGSAGMDLDLGSLQQDVVVVPLFTLDGIHVALEREGSKTNYGAILQNLARFESGEAPAEEEPSGPQKRFIVRQIAITDVNALLEWSDVASDQTALKVSIPEIRLRDIGAHNAQGVAMSELTDIVVKAILGAIAKHGTNLPGAVLGQLRSGVGNLESVPTEVVLDVGDKAVEKISGAVPEELGGAVRDVGGAAVGEAGKSVGEQASKTLEGLGGLLGGKRDEE